MKKGKRTAKRYVKAKDEEGVMNSSAEESIDDESSDEEYVAPGGRKATSKRIRRRYNWMQEEDGSMPTTSAAASSSAMVLDDEEMAIDVKNDELNDSMAGSQPGTSTYLTVLQTALQQKTKQSASDQSGSSSHINSEDLQNIEELPSSDEDNDEPTNIRVDGKYQIGPTRYIYYKPISTCMRAQGRVCPNLDEARARRRLRQSNYYDYTTPVLFENFGKPAQQLPEEFMFYVGEYTLNMTTPAEEFDEKLFYKLLAQFSFIIYKTDIKWFRERSHGYIVASQFRMDSNNTTSRKQFLDTDEQDKIWYRGVLEDENAHYLLAGSTAKSFLFSLDRDDQVVTSLCKLVANESAHLVFKSIQKPIGVENKKKMSITVDIYLSDSLMHENFVHEPSASLNKSESFDLNLVMSYFFLDQMYPDHALGEKFKTNTDTSTANKNETLFDLIYELRRQEDSFQANSKLDSQDIEMIQMNSCLKPNLRPYQIRAIKWMIGREKSQFEKEPEQHPLFAKLVNTQGQTIYYHKYYGMFCTEQMPLKPSSFPGGILADEMGLGKTLEVLGVILINKRQEFGPPPVYTPDTRLISLNKQSFSCLCGQAPVEFRMKTASYSDIQAEKKLKTKKEVYPCILCGTHSHPECLNYKDGPKSFLCLKCSVKSTVKSGCTLVVTPATISHQWADEIKKHINKNLKVLVYQGTQEQFLQPRDLAKYDICITTYETLANELKHVFAFENMRELRRAKRFMSVPCPLLSVEWWRICLDEAQLVHSSNTKCAEMANRLIAVNRWCITGTPIGRSLSDLHGLFKFIKEEPYDDKRWFEHYLYNPFKAGDKLPMARAVSSVLWRTVKKFVENEINIPAQTEQVFWLDFSSFELHLYQRVLETFKENRRKSFGNREAVGVDMAQRVEQFFAQFNNPNVKLDEIDRKILDQILMPLVDLRLVCNHPQLVLRKNTFNNNANAMYRKEKLLTMEQSLQILTKKTQSESDAFFRSLVKVMNSLAGLYWARADHESAVNYYAKILSLEKEYNQTLVADMLMKYHTLFNLVGLLREKPDLAEGRDPVLDSDELEEQMHACAKAYVTPYTENRAKSAQAFDEKHRDLHKFWDSLKKKKIHDLRWVLTCLKEIESNPELAEQFWDRLSNQYNPIQVEIPPEDANKENENATQSSKSSQSVDDKKPDGVVAKKTRGRKTKQQIAAEASRSDATVDEVVITRKLYIIFNARVESVGEIKELIENQLEKLIDERRRLIESLDPFKNIDEEMAQRAAACHLRHDLYAQRVKPTGKSLKRKYDDLDEDEIRERKNEDRAWSKAQDQALRQLTSGETCEICKCDNVMSGYAKHLFQAIEPVMARRVRREEEELEAEMIGATDAQQPNEEMNEAEPIIQQQQQNRHGIGELEKFTRVLSGFCRTASSNSDLLAEYAQLSKEHVELYSVLKEEFNAISQYWLNVSYEVNAYDELEMNTTRIRLLAPGETNPLGMDHLIERRQLDGLIAHYGQEENTIKASLNKRLGQLLFLKNTAKSSSIAEGKENEDICPICQNNLGYEWVILSCGHLYCEECCQALGKNPEFSLTMNGKKHIRCAMCRELCCETESHHVSTRKKDEDDEPVQENPERPLGHKMLNNVAYSTDINQLKSIKIKGECNSAKVEGIVKCLIKILRTDQEAKCIIFSEHITMLDLIIDLLKANFINYVCVKATGQMQKKVDEFKKDRDVSVLLMPYAYGANGLNLIEATHVLLVEPTLNKSQEAQAIGRVHRIGQTKPTYVYRFLIRNSIEDLVYNLFKQNIYSNKKVDTSQPNTSRALAKADNNDDQEDNKTSITINDLKKLFLNL